MQKKYDAALKFHGLGFRAFAEMLKEKGYTIFLERNQGTNLLAIIHYNGDDYLLRWSLVYRDTIEYLNNALPLEKEEYVVFPYNFYINKAGGYYYDVLEKEKEEIRSEVIGMVIASCLESDYYHEK